MNNHEAERHAVHDDYEACVLRIRVLSHLCGYVYFPADTLPNLIEDDTGGLLRYAPVHGGITYGNKVKGGGRVYGFDCAHAGDEADPRCADPDWVLAECDRLAVCLKVAPHFEQAYLTGKGNEEKADAIDAYHAELARRGIEFNLTDNFGAMISVLCGSL